MSSKSSLSEPVLNINEIDVYDKYKFINQIGQGSYGEVWLVAANKTSLSKSHTKQYILKRLNLKSSLNNPTQNEIENAEREAKLLSTLKHPNIVSYIDSFRSKDDFLNIVMTYCEGGDLYTKLKDMKTRKETLSEDLIVEWFIQICMALQYIHERNILHRDLKTQNIFLTKNDVIKIGDLGIARVLKSGTDFATTLVGTPYYMSPEIFLRKPYGRKSDIWSFGCCVFEMTTLEHAFNAKDIETLVLKILREETPRIPEQYSEPLRNLITSMLKKDSENRPTAKQILQNSYIKKHLLRLLEKTQTKCQNQSDSNVQPIVNNQPVTSTSVLPYSSSIISISPSKNRLSNTNTSILPSHPVLPPSHSRPPSGTHVNRSMPIAEPNQSENSIKISSKTRRSQTRQNDSEQNFEYLSKVSHNDTLQRRKRDLKLNNSSKQQQQQTSSSDEQDLSPIQSTNDIYEPIDIVHSLETPNSTESIINSSRSRSNSQTTKSCDLNQGLYSNARRRRRDKIQSTSIECTTLNQTTHSKEGDNDMNDLALMLTSTLQLPQLKIVDSHESTDVKNLNNDNKIKNENKSSRSRGRSSANQFYEKSRFQQYFQSIRENCLREISQEQLQRVLIIVQNLSGVQMTHEMVQEIGERLYNKYSSQIFALKFYQDNFLISS